MSSTRTTHPWFLSTAVLPAHRRASRARPVHARASGRPAGPASRRRGAPAGLAGVVDTAERARSNAPGRRRGRFGPPMAAREPRPRRRRPPPRPTPRPPRGGEGEGGHGGDLVARDVEADRRVEQQVGIPTGTTLDQRSMKRRKISAMLLDRIELATSPYQGRSARSNGPNMGPGQKETPPSL